jgi:tetratricopeptide (TPR) repeat protein
MLLRRDNHLIIIAAMMAGGVAGAGTEPPARAPFAGSASCRQCHEPFYQLWAPSHHGLAMQPYTFEFAQANLTAPQSPIKINGHEYLARIGREEGWILERDPNGERRLRIAHVMGGKNVYYFLTPLARGRLQTLPVAYDVRSKEWFDTAASSVRHFPGAGTDLDRPVDWTDPLYTFNTSCYACHVSQLSTNYDLKTDTYHTAWAEPGINCETCHGSGQEHVRLCRAAGGGAAPNDLKIIRTKSFTAEQTNSLCLSCHARMSPLTASFRPGDRYFDHFDLTALENPDFYPDGRDLGENYTMTGWRMSPCVQGGKLDCMHCHTSGGRYRFKADANPNAACLPCHQEKVDGAPAHTHHQADSTGNRCVACHMPTTEFARMTRSDHSMRPPTPAATLRFQSPNACNLCHTDKDAAWADQCVRQWHTDDYQKPVLERAALIEAARRGDWKALRDILAYIGSKDRDEVFAASLLRLLRGCPAPGKWPAAIRALQEDRSPLVRAAAAQMLEGCTTADSIEALAQATTDEYRLVRVRAAAAPAAIPMDQLPGAQRAALRRATAELLEAFRARADDYASQYNLGNYYAQRGDQENALISYQNSIRLRPDFVPPLVNIAFVYNAKGENGKAETSLRRALALDSNNATVQLNLGMLLGEMKRPAEAEQAFRRTFQIDPNSAAAAYNLGVLLAPDRPYESLRWCQKAYRLHPEEDRYGYTYAFYLNRQHQTDEAVNVLKEMVRRNVPYGGAYALLGEIYLGRGQEDEAAGVYRAAVNNEALTPGERDGFKTKLRGLEQGL